MTGPLYQAVAPLYRALRRGKNRTLNLVDPPLVILAYHRVTELNADPHQLCVTPQNFRAQLRLLRDHCPVIPLGDARQRRTEPAVAITFDDGYADNLHQALPLLEEARLPATFFIATGLLDSDREFWSDELERLLTGAGEREHLHQILLRLPPGARDARLAELRRRLGAGEGGRPSHRALSRAEVRTMAASPWAAIGAHGVSHTALALLSEQEQREELAASRRELEALTGRPVTHFAYPFGGRGQFSPVTCRLCREAGYALAVTTFPGQVHRWSDPLRLPRQLVRNWDAAEFTARLDGFWQ